MLRRISPLCAAILVSLSWSALPQSVAAAEFKTVARPVEGQYIVVLKTHEASLVGEASRAVHVPVVAQQMAAMHRADLVRSYSHVLRGFVVRADDAALARLLADPRVEYVEEDGIAEASATQTGATWGLDRVDQRDLPRNGSYTYNTTATGVHAYIVDTGILGTHSQFTGRMGNGYTAIADGRGTADCNGHGTHVAGTVGGTTYGVAKGVTLHPVRVLECNGTGTWSQVVAGMDWVKANHVKPAVANMSLGGWADTSVDTAAANLTASGVTLVVAAGNANGAACNFSPARAPSAITVGSIRNDDGRSSFSNYGSCLDIFAPGSSITSAWYSSATATNTISGTSMASPHVAGAAALYLAVNPTTTPSQVTTALINSSSPGRVLAAGAGSPNRLLYTLGGTASTPPGDGTLPTITDFSCPDRGDSGGNRYVCYVSYTSTSPAAILWPTAQQGDTFTSTCATGQTVSSLTVTIGNRYGSVSRSSGSFLCPSNPLP